MESSAYVVRVCLGTSVASETSALLLLLLLLLRCRSSGPFGAFVFEENNFRRQAASPARPTSLIRGSRSLLKTVRCQLTLPRMIPLIMSVLLWVRPVSPHHPMILSISHLVPFWVRAVSPQTANYRHPTPNATRECSRGWVPIIVRQRCLSTIREHLKSQLLLFPPVPLHLLMIPFIG